MGSGHGFQYLLSLVLRFLSRAVAAVVLSVYRALLRSATGRCEMLRAIRMFQKHHHHYYHSII